MTGNSITLIYLLLSEQLEENVGLTHDQLTYFQTSRLSVFHTALGKREN
jgi:hypothetical protein